MRTIPLAIACAFTLGGLAAGCGSDANPVDLGSGNDLATAPKPDMAKAPKPDMANAGTDPVGSACEDVSNCSGSRPVCRKSITEFNPAWPATDGYCSNEKCTDDGDCGSGGRCVGSGFCFQECKAKGECGAVNAANVCVLVDAQNNFSVCLPKQTTMCNPKDKTSCDGSGLCQRIGSDDVGNCFKTCKLADGCPPDAMGNEQGCYFLTFQIDVNGKDTGDVGANLTCLAADTGGPDETCMYLNSCQPGYECNFWKQGGVGKVCKKLCTNGGNECVIGECQNAFLLKEFKMGDIGLCM